MLLNDLLNLSQVLGSNFVTSINDFFTGQFKDNGLFGSFTHLTLKQLLKFLTFFNSWVKLLSDDFVITLLKAGPLLIDLSCSVITFSLDLGNLGINIRRLFTLRNGNFILNAFEGFVAGFFVYIGNNILCEVKHAVKITA